MKKRLFTSLMAVIAIIAILSTVTVTAYADEFVDSANGNYETQVDVNYHAYSTYSVTLPSILYEGSEAEIAIDMSNVEQGYHINGYISNLDENGQIPLYSYDYENNHALGKISVTSGYQPIPGDTGYFASFQDEHGNIASANVGYVIDERPTVAGDYSGVICFRFECVMD